MTIYQKTRQELIDGLEEMLHNIEHIKEISAHYKAKLPESVIQYVGRNYQLHLAILREKEYPTTAELYEKKWTEMVGK